MSAEIKWLGHASFRISGGGSVVYIDPWKIDGSPGDADVVFVSHSHFDHLSAEDIAKVSKDGTTLLASADAAAQIPGAKTLSPGDGEQAGGVAIEAVPAYNVGKDFHPRGNDWLGAVIELDEKRIYYAGDTDVIDEMSALENIDVALLPVGGTYTMNASEAAEACKSIGCKSAIPYHWGDIVGSDEDARSFGDAAGCNVHVLNPGEAVEI